MNIFGKNGSKLIQIAYLIFINPGLGFGFDTASLQDAGSAPEHDFDIGGSEGMRLSRIPSLPPPTNRYPVAERSFAKQNGVEAFSLNTHRYWGKIERI